MAKKKLRHSNRPAPETAQQPKYRYNESMINWEETEENTGCPASIFRNAGLLDQMLRGYKTKPGRAHQHEFSVSAVLRTDARLSLQQSVGGPHRAGHPRYPAENPNSTARTSGISSPRRTRRTCFETGNMGTCRGN